MPDPLTGLPEPEPDWGRGQPRPIYQPGYKPQLPNPMQRGTPAPQVGQPTDYPNYPTNQDATMASQPPAMTGGLGIDQIMQFVDFLRRMKYQDTSPIGPGGDPNRMGGGYRASHETTLPQVPVDTLPRQDPLREKDLLRGQSQGSRLHAQAQPDQGFQVTAPNGAKVKLSKADYAKYGKDKDGFWLDYQGGKYVR